MKKSLTALILVCCAAQPAAAAKYYIGVTPTANQVERYEAGVRAISSSLEKSSIRFVPSEGPIKKRGVVQLVVVNQGKESFNFGPENVRATLADGTVVPIITYEQLVREEKRRQTWAAIAVGLGAAANSMNAANAGYYSGSAHSYGRVGSTSYSGTTTFTGYNAGASYAAQANASMQNQMMFSQFAQANAARMNALRQNIRTSTLDPGSLFGGLIMFELPKNVRSQKANLPIKFAVEVGGESHVFETVISRRK